MAKKYETFKGGSSSKYKMNILKTKNLIYLSLLLFSFSAALSALPTSPEQLRDELTAAMKAQDKEKISILFNWRLNSYRKGVCKLSQGL